MRASQASGPPWCTHVAVRSALHVDPADKRATSHDLPCPLHLPKAPVLSPPFSLTRSWLASWAGSRPPTSRWVACPHCSACLCARCCCHTPLHLASAGKRLAQGQFLGHTSFCQGFSTSRQPSGCFLCTLQVPAFGGQSLFGAFTKSIGEELAHFPTVRMACSGMDVDSGFALASVQCAGTASMQRPRVRHQFAQRASCSPAHARPAAGHQHVCNQVTPPALVAALPAGPCPDL